jgi:uncharacterized protein YjiS (DUF1127 family)
MTMNPYMLLPWMTSNSINRNAPGRQAVAAVRSTAGVSVGLARRVERFREWRKRRAAIDELAALDDRWLKDIGLYRGEIEAAVDGLLERGLPAGADRRARPVQTYRGAAPAANENRPDIAA